MQHSAQQIIVKTRLKKDYGVRWKIASIRYIECL